LFLVTDRAGQGQGSAARADTRLLFSVTNRAGVGAGQGQGRARQGGQGRHPSAVFSYRQGRAGVGQGKATRAYKNKHGVCLFVCLSNVTSLDVTDSREKRN